MTTLDHIKQLDIDDFKRFRIIHARLDEFSLCASYNYTYFDYENKRDELIRSIYHKTTHLYQMLTTPYGFYYNCLRDLQTSQAMALIKLFAKIRIPLIDMVSSLSPSRFQDIWYNLYIWFIAEMIATYFEGRFDLIVKRFESGRFPNQTLDDDFDLIERSMCHYLGEYAPQLSSIPAASESERTFRERLHRTMLMMKIFLGFDTFRLLETWARLSQYWGDDDSKIADIRGTPDKQGYYQVDFFSLAGSLPANNVREFVLTLSAICELSLFSPILPHYSALRGGSSLMNDLDPGQRCRQAIEAAKRLQPIRRLEQDHGRFIQELCSSLNWIPPATISTYTLANFRFPDQHLLSGLYYNAQAVRKLVPWIFLDQSLLWSDLSRDPEEFVTRFRFDFVHPIIEFKDRVLYHNDKSRCFAFVQRFLLSNYLRKVLLSDDISVQLPFRATESEIKFFEEALFDTLSLVAGLEKPHVVVRAPSVAE